MSAPLKNVAVRYNNGIGNYPVSMIIDFYEDEEVNVKDLYNTIKANEYIKDIIFRENTAVNEETLSWVTPKLISEGYFVSIYSDTLPYTSYNRLITTITHPNLIRKNIKFLQALTDRDLIILDVDSLDYIIFCRKLLLKSQIKTKVMFNSYKVDSNKVIDAYIYDILPIGL